MHGARIAALSLILVLSPALAQGQTLRGSKTTMVKQNRVALDHDYTFLRNEAHVRKFIDLGLLVPVRGNAHYELARVSNPFARPALKLFIERLAAQYYSACGERLVVTSLTRPLNEQPRNASDLSVHPTGMAVDLRISRRASCRRWLERTLLSLERQGVLDGIREHRPPHYHIALFPTQYVAYVERITGGSSVLATADAPAAQAVASGPQVADETIADQQPDVADANLDGDGADGSSDASAMVPDISDNVAPPTIDYRVSRGESLWSIARRHGVTVEALRAANGISGSRLDPGQVLRVPVESD